MGLLGGFLTIPINALFAQALKRDELLYQHRLGLVAKKQELLLQHRLEMERYAKDNEIAEIKAALLELKRAIEHE